MKLLIFNRYCCQICFLLVCWLVKLVNRNVCDTCNICSVWLHFYIKIFASVHITVAHSVQTAVW